MGRIHCLLDLDSTQQGSVPTETPLKIFYFVPCVHINMHACEYLSFWLLCGFQLFMNSFHRLKKHAWLPLAILPERAMVRTWEVHETHTLRPWPDAQGAGLCNCRWFGDTRRQVEGGSISFQIESRSIRSRRTIRHPLLLRCIGWKRKPRDGYHRLS